MHCVRGIAEINYIFNNDSSAFTTVFWVSVSICAQIGKLMTSDEACSAIGNEMESS